MGVLYVSFYTKELFGTNNSINIPKIIHMTCKDKHNLSAFYQQNLDSWKKYHSQSQWKINIYDDKDLETFFTTNYPSLLPLINSYSKIIYKVDIFKILVLNKYGGVYVDMDVECLKSIDPLLNNSNETAIFGYGPYEHNNGNYKNMKLIECAIMISMPNHKLWNKYVIPGLISKNECKGNAVECTGPVFITHNIEKYNRENNVNDIKLMEPIYFYPINNQFPNRISKEKINETKQMLKTRNFPKESYCVHYFDGAWWNKNSKTNN